MGGVFELRPKLFLSLVILGSMMARQWADMDCRDNNLMVVFGVIKRGQGLISVTIGLGQSPEASVSRLIFRDGSRCSLWYKIIERYCADIIALSIQGRWIVGAPDVGDIFKRNDFRINVICATSRASRRHCAPGSRWILYRPTGIAGHDALHAL